MSPSHGVNVHAEPSGTGCKECLAMDSWWFHLRRCAECGHIGCCDSSPNQHATKHFHESKHPIIASFEPGEGWFWSFETSSEVPPQRLASPISHPVDQPVPGPEGSVPDDWESLLN